MVTKIGPSIPAIPVLEKHQRPNNSQERHIQSSRKHKIKAKNPTTRNYRNQTNRRKSTKSHRITTRNKKEKTRNKNQISMGSSHIIQNKWEHNSKQGNKTTHRNRKQPQYIP